MNEKIRTGAPPIEHIEKSEYTPEIIAGMLGRHLPSEEIGPVGRPEMGYSNAIFRFSLNSQPHFIRLRSGAEVETQTALNSLLRENDIPVAEVVTSGYDDTLNTSFIIEKTITGADLHESDRPSVEVSRLLVEAGTLLSRIHDINLPGFGKLTNSDGLTGKLSSWPDFLEKLKPDAAYLLEHKLITPEDAQHFEKAYEKMRAQNPEQGVLLHNDFSAVHIFADDEGITGVIDWDRALVGDPNYDIAVSKVQSRFEGVIENGYDKPINTDLVDAYALYIVFTKLAWRHKNKLDTTLMQETMMNRLRDNNCQTNRHF